MEGEEREESREGVEAELALVGSRGEEQEGGAGGRSRREKQEGGGVG